MTEFVKKGSLGGYRAVTGGRSDPECTHVIMTRSEYVTLLSQLQEEKNKVSAAAYQAEQTVRSITNRTNMEIRQNQEAADKTVEEMQKRLDEEQAETEYQRRLNSNLLRISKERANAARKLKPKKEHSGYVVISSMEKDHIYKRGSNRNTVRLWETVLQTPYSIDFTEEQARKESGELFRKNESVGWLIGKIGINGLYLDGYGEMIHSQDAGEWMQRNVMVEQKLRANYRAGYWEMVFLHTKPLGIVPADMLPG